MLADGSWIFLLEALLALVLAVLIVWWTLPGKRKHDPRSEPERRDPPPQEPPGH